MRVGRKEKRNLTFKRKERKGKERKNGIPV